MNEIRRENNKGITLIALIIVTFILLILTAVTVDIVIGNDYFGKAKDTIGQANEQINNQTNLENEIKTDWNELPGNIIKSPTKENTTINISVVASNITTNSFRINARGTNANGDTLTFTLTVNEHEQVFTEKKDKEVSWEVTGLNQYTEYKFTVVATYGDEANSVTGVVKTYCPGYQNNVQCTTVTSIVNETDCKNCENGIMNCEADLLIGTYLWTGDYHIVDNGCMIYRTEFTCQNCSKSYEADYCPDCAEIIWIEEGGEDQFHKSPCTANGCIEGRITEYNYRISCEKCGYEIYDPAYTENTTYTHTCKKCEHSETDPHND